MSATRYTRITLVREEDGWVATDEKRGVSRHGESRTTALERLDRAVTELDNDDDRKEQLKRLSETTQARFAEEGVAEDDIEDAIEWARSE